MQPKHLMFVLLLIPVSAKIIVMSKYLVEMWPYTLDCNVSTNYLSDLKTGFYECKKGMEIVYAVLVDPQRLHYVNRPHLPMFTHDGVDISMFGLEHGTTYYFSSFTNFVAKPRFDYGSKSPKIIGKEIYVSGTTAGLFNYYFSSEYHISGYLLNVSRGWNQIPQTENIYFNEYKRTGLQVFFDQRRVKQVFCKVAGENLEVFENFIKPTAPISWESIKVITCTKLINQLTLTYITAVRFLYASPIMFSFTLPNILYTFEENTIAKLKIRNTYDCLFGDTHFWNRNNKIHNMVIGNYAISCFDKFQQNISVTDKLGIHLTWRLSLDHKIIPYKHVNSLLAVPYQCSKLENDEVESLNENASFKLHSNRRFYLKCVTFENYQDMESILWSPSVLHEMTVITFETNNTVFIIGEDLPNIEVKLWLNGRETHEYVVTCLGLPFNKTFLELKYQQQDGAQQIACIAKSDVVNVYNEINLYFLYSYKIGFSYRFPGKFFEVYLTYASLNDVLTPSQIFSKLGKIQCLDLNSDVQFTDKIEQNKLIKEVNIFKCKFLRIDESSRKELYQMEMSGHVYVLEHSIAYSCKLSVQEEIIRGLKKIKSSVKVVSSTNSNGNSCWKFTCNIEDDKKTELNLDTLTGNAVILGLEVMKKRQTYIRCGHIEILVLEFDATAETSHEENSFYNDSNYEKNHETTLLNSIRFEDEQIPLNFEQIGKVIIPEIYKQFHNSYGKTNERKHPGRYCWFKEMLPPKWQRGVVYLRTQIRHRFKTKLMCSLYIPSTGGEKDGQLIDTEFEIIPAAAIFGEIKPNYIAVFNRLTDTFICKIEPSVLSYYYNDPNIKIFINKIVAKESIKKIYANLGPQKGAIVSIQCYLKTLLIARMNIQFFDNYSPVYEVPDPFIRGFSEEFDTKLKFYLSSLAYSNIFRSELLFGNTDVKVKTYLNDVVSWTQLYSINNMIDSKKIKLKIVNLNTKYIRTDANESIKIDCIVDSVLNYNLNTILMPTWILMNMEVKFRPPIIEGNILHINSSVYDGHFCFLCTLWKVRLKKYSLEHCFNVLTHSLLEYVINPHDSYPVIHVSTGDRINASLLTLSKHHDFPKSINMNIKKIVPANLLNFGYKRHEGYLQVLENPKSVQINLTVSDEIKLNTGFKELYLIVSADLRIVFPIDRILYVEKQPFSLTCNLRFKEIGNRFPHLFSWKVILNNTRVANQTLTLYDSHQARVKYKCEFNSGSLHLERELNIIVVKISNIKLYVVSSVNSSLFMLGSADKFASCILRPDILKNSTNLMAYWKSSETSTININKYEEGAHNEICTTNVEEVASLNWTFIIADPKARVMFTFETTFIDNDIPRCVWDKPWMNQFIDNYLQPHIELKYVYDILGGKFIYSGEKKHVCFFHYSYSIMRIRRINQVSLTNHQTNRIVINGSTKHTIFEKSMEKILRCEFSHHLYNKTFYPYLKITLNGILNKWGNLVMIHLLDEGYYKMICSNWKLRLHLSYSEVYEFTVVDDTLQLKLDKQDKQIYVPTEDLPSCIWNKPYMHDLQTIQTSDKVISNHPGFSTWNRNCTYNSPYIKKKFVGYFNVANENSTIIYVSRSVDILTNIQVSMEPVSCFVSAYSLNPPLYARFLNWYSVQPHFLFENIPQHQRIIVNITRGRKVSTYGTYICAGLIGKIFYSFIYTITTHVPIPIAILIPFRRLLISDDLIQCHPHNQISVGFHTIITVFDVKNRYQILVKYGSSAIITVDKATRAEINCIITQMYLDKMLSHTSTSFAVVIMRKGYISLVREKGFRCEIIGPMEQDMTMSLKLLKAPNYFKMKLNLALDNHFRTGGTFIFGCILNDALGTLWVEQILIHEERPPSNLYLSKYKVKYEELIACAPNGYPLTDVVTNIMPIDPAVILNTNSISGTVYFGKLNDYGQYNISCHATGYHSSIAFDLKTNFTITIYGIEYKQMLYQFDFETRSCTYIISLKILLFFTICGAISALIYRSSNMFEDKIDKLEEDTPSEVLINKEYTFDVTTFSFYDLFKFLAMCNVYEEYMHKEITEIGEITNFKETKTSI